MKRDTWKQFGKLLACLLITLPAGAKADDTALFAFGGSGGSNGWPATIIFGLDISTSMWAHNCRDCYLNDWYLATVTNGAKICANKNFDTMVGPDRDGDNERDTYLGPYEDDGLTWRGFQYRPILDDESKEITYKSCTIWYPYQQSGNSNKKIDPDPNSSPTTCGRIGADDQKDYFDAEVKAYCSKYASCEEANRCIYSMRTRGYFSPSRCTGATGDPYGACSCSPYTPSEDSGDSGDPTVLDFWTMADNYGTNTSCTSKTVTLKNYSSTSTLVDTSDNASGTVDDTVSHSNNQLYYSKVYPESGKSSAAGGLVSICDGVMNFTGGGTLYAQNPPAGAKLDTYFVHGKPFEVKASQLVYNSSVSCTSNCDSPLAYDPKLSTNSAQTMVDDPTSYSVQMQVDYQSGKYMLGSAADASNNPQVGIMLKHYSISESADASDNDYVYMTIAQDGTVYIGNYRSGSGSSYQQDVTPVIPSAWGGGDARCLKIKEVRNHFYFYVNTSTKTGKVFGHDVTQCVDSKDNWKLVQTLVIPSIPESDHQMVAGLIAGSSDSTATAWNSTWGKAHPVSAVINEFAIKYSKGIGKTLASIPGTQWSLSKYNADGHLGEISANTDNNFSMLVEAEHMTFVENVKTSGNGITGQSASPVNYIAEFVFPGVKGTYNLEVKAPVSNSAKQFPMEIKVINGTDGSQRYSYKQNFDQNNNTRYYNNVPIHKGDIIRSTLGWEGSRNEKVNYDYMKITGGVNYIPTAETLKKIPAKYAHYKNSLGYYQQANSGSGAVEKSGDGRIDIYVPKAGRYKLFANAVGKETNIKNITVKIGSTEGKIYFNKKEAETKQMQDRTGNEWDCCLQGNQNNCWNWGKCNNYTYSDKTVTLSTGVNTLTFKEVDQVDYINWFALVPADWDGDFGSNVPVGDVSADSGNYCGFDATGLVVKSDAVNQSKTTNNSSFQDSSKVAYTGDWMNFNPRRDHAVASAMYGLMDMLNDDIRVGTTYFYDYDSNTGLHKPRKNSNTTKVWPSCTEVVSSENCKDGDKDTPCFKQEYREYFKEEFYSFVAEKSYTPLARLENHIGEMASSTDPDTALFCDKCQANVYMVLLTDGEPAEANKGTEQPTNGVCKNNLDFSKKLFGKDITDGVGKQNNYCMDEIAYILNSYDVFNTSDGVNNTLSTYTISFALADENDPDKCPGVLQDTADAGGGACIPAYDVQSLQEALTSIVADIMPRAMTYTAPSVAAVRGSGENTVVSSTFVPTNDLPFWEAHMYKFALCDEKDADRPSNCECGNRENNEEICIVGANGLPIEYKNSKLATPPFWDAQLCLSGDFLGKHHGVGIPQDPFSIDVSSCYRYADESAADAVRRKIYTVIDTDGNGIYNSKDDMVELLATGPHFDALASMLQVNNTKAKKIIGFLRGIDVFDMDHDGDYDEERSLSTMLDGTGNVVQGWWKMGDIFHSAPLLIGSLSDSFYQASYRSLTNNTSGFAGIVKDRPAIYVTGANDGMLHAFHAGNYNNKGVLKDDTGAELWAFIPPSAMGKFQNMCKINDSSCSYKRKQYFVDSSPSYRDVWIGDDNDDLTKESNKNKWKTVLIGGMRQGGNYYFGLDITDTAAPKFLWEFPPQDPVKAKAIGVNEIFGETWLETGASPSAVGTIQLDSGHPKWVALLGGGYSQLDQGGRGYYVIDPYTGELLYAAEHGGSGGDLNRMNYSFAATPVFTDPKTFVDVKNQTIMMFTKIVAVDHGGQVWMQELPVTKISGNKIVNWPAPEVVFSANKTLITPSTDTNKGANYQTKQIFFLPVTSVTGDNKLRAVFGTGDRAELMKNGTSYEWDDKLCFNPGRIYSIILGKCNDKPCTESDLVELKVKDLKVDKVLSEADAAKAKKTGWYITLADGERVVNPPSLAAYRKDNGESGGMVVITTYQPTFVCDPAGTNTLLKTCGTNDGTNGIGRLYMLDLETGALLDDIQQLEGELPADPRITTKVGATVESAILLPGGRDNPTPTVQRTNSGENALKELFRIDVTRDIHNALHTN